MDIELNLRFGIEFVRPGTEHFPGMEDIRWAS